MSIHGKILINAHDIGEWTIRRQQQVSNRRPNTYEYGIAVDGGLGLDGNLIPARDVQGVVEHGYQDGAIALLARVFADAQKQIAESIDTVGTAR